MRVKQFCSLIINRFFYHSHIIRIKSMKTSIRILYIFIFIFLIGTSCKNKNERNATKKTNPFRKLTKEEKKNYHYQAELLYSRLIKGNFSGGIIVAKNGQIIFEDYRGYSNWMTKEPLNAKTPIHIASVSKTFTAVAVLKLIENGKIFLKDSLQRFFPDFPYSGITIEQLLNHRSGLPNYLYFMDTVKLNSNYIVNKDVLKYLVEQKPNVYAYPNRVFHYCNTNYVLLALIIEKVTNQTFPEYMHETIFKPLGMNNSFVFCIQDTAKYKPSFNFNNQPFIIDKYDVVHGDKNIYSTVQDMLQWDNALYDTSFLSTKLQKIAFTPYSNEKPGKKNYGLGFRLFIDGNDTTIYHNGWWHGNNAVFTRLLKDTATIITLGNKYNRAIYGTRRIANIFSSKNLDSNLEE